MDLVEIDNLVRLTSWILRMDTQGRLPVEIDGTAAIYAINRCVSDALVNLESRDTETLNEQSHRRADAPRHRMTESR